MRSTSSPRCVAVVGSEGTLARRVTERLEGLPSGHEIRALGTLHRAEGVESLLAGIDTVVHLDRWPCPVPDDDCATIGMRLVEGASAAGVGHVVAVSSAVVYGAWPDNPVPLTEDAALRPNPGGAYALGKAETERRWGQWADERRGAALTILRPAQVVGDDDEQWLAVALRAATRWGVGDAEVPAQFVHVDDLASAVVLAVDRSLDGIFNVAPEGWLEGSEIQALAGTPLRPPVPPALASGLARWCWSRGLGGVSPEWVPYATHPWVVAGDRLRAEGFEPAHTAAQTLLESFPVTPWSRLASRHRRALALTGGVAGGLALPASAVALARWARRHRGTGLRVDPAG